ncbi:DNA repair protein complementing XP-G cells [Ooceraea biroi]|uniref:DNA repair protein complementing XP-G cells n=1 Tax=Ooceraea biroi TaxID=2015173 RepID=A0A026WS80_OOCBI|nr:DNA repair protein complementing XP-G cells [Ooceraea biroi]
MGVHGLWRLLDASGKPVPLESLEGKVLAIDISIWIYQILQGYQDRHGSPRPNAHLLGLFVRICKLLYYKIKPVFIFDGGVPILKKNTIASRRKQKSIAMSKAQKMKTDLINNLIKHSVVRNVLNKDSKPDQSSGAREIPINMRTKHSVDDMFVLPDMPSTSNVQTNISDDEDDSDTSLKRSPRKQSKWIGNIHSIDVTSSEFKALPADVRYDILNDLKETRKQNSWSRLHEMPYESQEFSGFQLNRLLKRRYVQESLESAEKEMGGKTLTLEELDKLLTEQGINTKGRDTAFRIAADDTTRLIYISDKNALAKSSVNNGSETDKNMSQSATEEVEVIAGPSNPTPIVENMNEYELNDDDSDDDVDTLIDYSESLPIVEDVNEYAFDSDSDRESETDTNESRTSAKRYFSKNTTNPALTYLLEHSSLTQNQIMHLIKHNKSEGRKVVNKKIKTPDVCLELTEDGKQTIDKPTSVFLENSEQVAKSVELHKTTCKSDENKTIELIPSSPESDNFVEVEPLKSVETWNITITSNIPSSQDNGPKEPSATPSNDVTQTDTLDSDSDDFIEVQDVPIFDASISKDTARKKNLEIAFKPGEKPKDDIFADIFGKADKSKSPTNSEQSLSIRTNRLISNPEKSNNLKRNVLTPIPEETIIKEVKAEPQEDTRLTENISNDEAKICDCQNSNEQMEQNNADTLTDVDKHTQEEKPVTLPTSEKDLIELKEQLEDEQEELTRGIGKFERQATNISDQIKTEAQELLRLFGIPYIVAPMEAEAQCAYLERIKLTDGTITDDSDIWLFGSECVYKNFFNNNKRVLQFCASDIQQHFKLSRNQLIQLAILVGSDYTTGLTGIGPVTALEILAAFPAEGDNILHGLHNFSSWMKNGRIAAPGKTGLRNKLQNVKVDNDFPSQAVVQAYLFPTVDESKETFTWGKPNIVLLYDYTRQKFGWTKGKFDDTVIPVLKRMEEKKSQKLLDTYFKTKTSPRSIEPSLSKRVQKAVRKLNDDVDEENADGESQAKRSKKCKADQTSKKKKNDDNVTWSSHQSIQPTYSETNVTLDKPVKSTTETKCAREYIPQREKDKACALKKKLHAIEVFRKSKQGLGKTRKIKRTVRKIKTEAELSESDSN